DIYQCPVHVATNRYSFANRAEDQRKVLQKCTRAAVILGIAKTIFSDIERLVASRATIDSFQNAIDTLWINLSEIVIQAWIIAYCTRADEAPPEEFIRNTRIKTDHFSCIVVDTVKISCPRSMLYGVEHHI